MYQMSEKKPKFLEKTILFAEKLNFFQIVGKLLRSNGKFFITKEAQLYFATTFFSFFNEATRVYYTSSKFFSNVLFFYFIFNSFYLCLW